ncbi:cyclic AMP-dependent transcription factor ATF-6 alpha [Scleropages formosus]|uniref:Activating transcription factor 6 n=1 Tax=Scleropages formosus TaxID=113540 RepID=A0A8C9R1B1_SCLFO|nr:cyclic AMP-dependent transcription factor ATF-6 alpha-like [Scleropages formosus]
MATDLMLELENLLNERDVVTDDPVDDIFEQQPDDDLDISVFDELDSNGDTDELLKALDDLSSAGDTPELTFGVDFPPWNYGSPADTDSSYTEAEMAMDTLSPYSTVSSVSSPGSTGVLSPCSPHAECQSPPTPLSVASSVTPQKKPQERSKQPVRVKPSQPPKPPIHLAPKVSIQPKPAVNMISVPHTVTTLQTKPIVIQTLQPAVPVPKLSPVTLQPAILSGHPVMLPQPTRMVQLHPQGVTTQTTTLIPDQGVPFPAVVQGAHTQTLAGTKAFHAESCLLAVSTQHNDANPDVFRRQQRMIKNRESASLSRKKKKEYLLMLEARLKVALLENEKLKNENGSLKKQLDGLLTENKVLKATGPRRRKVCLLGVLLFLMLTFGPMRLFEGDSSSRLSAVTTYSSRHLLSFSPREMAESISPQNPERQRDSASEEKALMVIKRDPLFFRPVPPCQPPINRTKSIKMAHELRGWVHRHEVERTKSRRMNNSLLKNVEKSSNKDPQVAEVVTVEYPDLSDKNSTRELQIYYAPHRGYNDLFEEIRRRGDTFYVVSFRRDHLLLPATNHNKGSRPKMSVVLPAININDNVIKDDEYEVMMQIDCEVVDTRILHIKASSIPQFLRVNHTSSFYQSTSPNTQATPPLGVLVGSA